jgi:outer membrane cobalamin receptor
MPTETYSVSAAYNLYNKFIFTLGVDGQGKRYARQIGGNNNLVMKGFADLNLRVDYRLKGVVRFWVQGSNLINQRYQVWYGYNSYRLNIMGGISASF